MKPTTSSWIAIGLIVAVGFGVGVHQWHYAREAEAASATTERQSIAAQAELIRWKNRRAAAEQSRQVAQAELVQLQHAKEAATRPPKKSLPTYGERLQKDPAFQLLHLANERAHLLVTYGALFKKLAFSPEQITRFEDIAIRRKEREMDLTAIVEAQHLTWDDPVVKKMQQERASEYEAAARSLLDEASFKEVQDYDRALWMREMIAGWAAGAVVAIREPFTAQQGEALAQIMKDASTSYRNGFYLSEDEPDYWEAVDAEARKILTPAQFQMFTTMEPPLPYGARYQQQLYQKVNRALEAEKNAAAKAATPGS